MDDVIEIDSDSDSDYDEDDYIPSMVKIEDSDSSDDSSEVDPDENQDDVLVEDVNEGEGGKSTRLGIGRMLQTQTTTDYISSWSNNYNHKGGPKEVNMAQAESIGTSYPDEDEFLQGFHVGSVYKANQGVINVNLTDNAETPPAMSED